MPEVSEKQYPRMTVEEYLKFEETAEIKHEYHYGVVLPVWEAAAYISGVPVMMPGVTENHDRIVINLIGTLRSALKGTPCSNFSADLKVQVDRRGKFVYPDSTVACEPLEFRVDERERRTLVNPKVVFEVLSESTKAYDRGEKLERYLATPTIEEVFLLSQDQPHVQGFRRNDDGSATMRYWTGLDTVVKIEAIGIELSLAELYENVKFEAGA